MFKSTTIQIPESQGEDFQVASENSFRMVSRRIRGVRELVFVPYDRERATATALGILVGASLIMIAGGFFLAQQILMKAP